MLCVSIMVESVERAFADAARAAERGADLVEYRLDTFIEAGGDVRELVTRSPLPCVVTCRPAWEGGAYEGDEAMRLAVLRTAAATGTARIDLEWQTMQRGDVGEMDSTLICSSHDFDTRPADLQRRLQAMAGCERCAIVKLAWRARSLRDNLEAFELLRERPKPMIALCMGEFGLPSRVLAKKFGGFLTFAGLEDDALTAPGQVGVDTMKRLYRWDHLREDTRVYGVIGWPVGHSLSPHIMNAGFDATDYNGVYLPMPIPPEYEHFKATVGSWLDFQPLHFRGASVTIPHKQNLLRFVAERGGEIEPLARRIGAANTLEVRDDGSLYACNTDYAAALDAVCDALGIAREQLAGQRVGVIGAGGAARAVVAAFAHYGATIVIYNRTIDKAQRLAGEFARPHSVGTDAGGKIVAAPLDNLGKCCCDILINCTPIGMHPDVDATPVTGWPERLGPGAVVFDTIYNPEQTRLLREAAAAGAATISGVEMFVRQGAAQFERWTGETAPTDVFQRIVREHLTPSR